jgi:membrane protease YdiL (CAAX protease family)
MASGDDAPDANAVRARSSQFSVGNAPVGLFLVATFATTWVAWTASWALPTSGMASSLRGPLFLAGVWAPALVSIALVATHNARGTLRAFLGQVIRFPSSPGWYLFAIGYLVALRLASAAIARVVGGAWPSFGETRPLAILVAITISTWVQTGEELGWRGYALPALASRVGAARASLVIGIAWAVWHLPLFFVGASDLYHHSFPEFLVQVTALSVTMAWLYYRTNGSLFIVMLMHATVNNTTTLVRSGAPLLARPFDLDRSVVGWTLTLLLCVGAAYFFAALRMNGVNGFGRHSRAEAVSSQP